jgi:hypothetical protein
VHVLTVSCHTHAPPAKLRNHLHSKLYDVGMRQSAAWGLYLVAGTTAHHASLALSLLLGGSMVYAGGVAWQARNRVIQWCCQPSLTVQGLGGCAHRAGCCNADTHCALLLTCMPDRSPCHNAAYTGTITAEQLTSFMFYVQLVTASSLAVCDQYGAIMEVCGCGFGWV